MLNFIRRKAGNKYGARKVTLDGYQFASQREATHYIQLTLRVRAGEIHRLEIHPVYKLAVNGVKIGRYTADFQYRDVLNGNLHVIDVKSPPTAKGEAFRLRKRLVEALYPGVTIEIVY